MPRGKTWLINDVINNPTQPCEGMRTRGASIKSSIGKSFLRFLFEEYRVCMSFEWKVSPPRQATNAIICHSSSSRSDLRSPFEKNSIAINNTIPRFERMYLLLSRLLEYTVPSFTTFDALYLFDRADRFVDSCECRMKTTLARDRSPRATPKATF